MLRQQHHLRKEDEMLEEYIRQYEEAVAAGDRAAMKRIERELGILGMDRATLLVLVNERRKEAKQ